MFIHGWWLLMVIHGFLLLSNGYGLFSVVITWWLSMVFCCYWWFSINIDGYPWFSVVIDGYGWFSVVINGFLLLLMVFNGYWWLSIRYWKPWYRCQYKYCRHSITTMFTVKPAVPPTWTEQALYCCHLQIDSNSNCRFAGKLHNHLCTATAIQCISVSCIML